MKLVGIDMDGTLLDDNNEVSITQKEFFENNQLEEVEFVIVTGRPLKGVLNLLPQRIWGNFFKICLNGSVIFDKNNELIYKNIIPTEQYYLLLNYLHQNHLRYLVLDTQDFYGEKIDELMVYDAKLNKMEIKNISFEKLKSLEEVSKILLFIAPEKRDSIFETIPQEIKEKFSVIFSQDYLIEFLNHGVDKGSAFKRLSNGVGKINNITTYSIGDGLNDIPFMKSSDIKIAMKNSNDEVLKLSDYITDDNNHDGVLKAIKQLVMRRDTSANSRF
ncbi:HAD family hydrolase [Ignavigranum ruoffiae]|uniref:HAD family hydrolase n=1 Tax=Ignavigranum ruoffiae TaxID=89093 RepID=UPI003B000DB7